MVNGKAQIYFDALGQLNISQYFLMEKSVFLDEAPAITKPTRNIRTTNTTRLPEQMKHQPPPPPPSRKPPPAHPPTKPMKKTNKVTFSDNQSQGGVFMTMDEIAELVKAAKESSQLPTHPNMEYRGNYFCLNALFNVLLQNHHRHHPFHNYRMSSIRSRMFPHQH